MSRAHSQLILQPFRRFTYVTTHSPTLPLLHLRHSSFSNPSLALPTSQLILLPFLCFTYVTADSPTLLSFLLRHRIFTYVTWRAAHVRPRDPLRSQRRIFCPPLPWTANISLSNWAIMEHCFRYPISGHTDHVVISIFLILLYEI